MQFNPLDNNHLLYYLHIPKTAGTSFTEIIMEKVGANFTYQPTAVDQFLNTPQEVAEKIRFISGHLVYDLSPVITRKLIYLTMLRDPVARTISQYGQVRRVTGSLGNDIAKDQSLLDFVKDPRNKFLFSNLQTRQLGLEANVVQMVAGQDSSYMTHDLASRILLYSSDRCDDPVLLENAQRRLESFDFVGLAEFFNASIEVLCRTLGWELPNNPKLLNVGVDLPVDIPQEAIDIIHQQTQFDSMLYETGKRILEERYKRLCSKELQPSVDLSGVDERSKRLQIMKDLLAQRNEQIEFLLKENQRLSQIENSSTWRLVLRLAALRRKVIPAGSKRERIYLKLLGRSGTHE